MLYIARFRDLYILAIILMQLPHFDVYVHVEDVVKTIIKLSLIVKVYFVGVHYTGCPRRNVRDFGRVFLMLNYIDITQNTYVQS